MLCGISISAQEINWLSFEEAVEAQKKEPRKIMVDAYTTWCGPCKLLDQHTFQNKDLVKYVNDNYYAVKFNAEGNETVAFKEYTFSNPNFDPNRKNGRNSPHQLTSYFRVTGYPTMLFLDEESNFLLPISGYRTPRQLEIYLKLFGSDAYKNITSKEAWQEYASGFKYEFIE
jgi:thioredoxin-related protein